MTFSQSQEPKKTPEKCLCCATESILKAFVMMGKNYYALSKNTIFRKMINKQDRKFAVTFLCAIKH